MIHQLFGEHLQHVTIELDIAFDTQQAGPQQCVALAVYQVGLDDHVGHAGLILEGGEHRTLGALGALPVGHNPCHPSVRPTLA